jgi:hypothetical protein
MLLKWLASKLVPYLMRFFVDAVEDAVVRLDPEKLYFLFLPTTVDEDDLKEQITPFRDKLNLMVVTVDHFKLIEF